ncbi:MAG: AmmeMemoRadiSam system protein B [Bacillota bacterium]
MGIKIAGLSPHPPLIIPEVGGEERKKVKKTINSLKEMAQEFANEDLDLLITISPHGAVFRDAIAAIDFEVLKGDFRDFGVPHVNYEVNNFLEFVDKLKENSLKKDIKLLKLNKSDLRSYGMDKELDHGVLVPLHYLQEAKLEVPVVPLSMGLLNYNTLYEFGKLIDNTLKEMNLKGALLASGDLSHRLKPGAPAGYNPKAKNFDNKLINLLEEENFKDILKINKSLIEKAGECGLRPIIMTLGALDKYDVESDLKSYEGPFGVGYAVCTFNINE